MSQCYTNFVPLFSDNSSYRSKKIGATVHCSVVPIPTLSVIQKKILNDFWITESNMITCFYSRCIHIYIPIWYTRFIYSFIYKHCKTCELYVSDKKSISIMEPIIINSREKNRVMEIEIVFIQFLSYNNVI